MGTVDEPVAVAREGMASRDDRQMARDDRQEPVEVGLAAAEVPRAVRVPRGCRSAEGDRDTPG
jgi:hypothetical protein